MYVSDLIQTFQYLLSVAKVNSLWVKIPRAIVKFKVGDLVKIAKEKV
jgi:hypothetical protein